jgi:cytochrome c-type biogenesis protein CcmH
VIALMVVVLFLTGSPLLAQQEDRQGTPPPASGYDEREAQAIDKMLMCPVCPAITIDQANVELAQQMRSLVREMLAQGASRDEILAFFAQRYGTDVLAAPPKTGANLLVWVLPVVAVVAVLLAGLFVIRTMSRRGSGEPITEPGPGDDLDEYLDQVDRELSLADDPTAPNERSYGAPGSRRPLVGPESPPAAGEADMDLSPDRGQG